MPQIGDRKTSPDGRQQAEYDGQGWTIVSSPTHARPADSQPADSGAPFEQYHATGSDTPFSAGAKELGRTALEAGKGLMDSPMDMLHGLFGLPKAAAEGVGHLVKDPSLLTEIPRAAANTVGAITDPSTNPRDMGSLLGQTMIGEALPGAVKGAVKHAPAALEMAGRGVSAVGRGAERAGTSDVMTKLVRPFGAAEGIYRGDLKGIAAAAAPTVLEYGGKGLQKVGGMMERGGSRIPSIDPFMANTGGAQAPRVPRGSEVPYRAADSVSNVDGLNTPEPAPHTGDVQMPQSMESLINRDRYAPNESGHQPGAYGESAAGVENSGVDPHMANTSGGSSGYADPLAELPPSIQQLIQQNATPPSEFPAGQGANGQPLAAGELAGDGNQKYMHSQFEQNQGTAREALGHDRPLVDQQALEAQMPDIVRALAEKVGLASDSRFPGEQATNVGELGAGRGDLLSEYMNSVDGPVAPFEMDGQSYAANDQGSHVAVPESVAALTGKPRVQMSSSGYPASWDLAEADLEPSGARRRSEKAYKARGYATRD